MDLDKELEPDGGESSLNVQDRLRGSQSQQNLSGRFSINQLRMDRLEKYNQQRIDHINKIPQLLNVYDGKIEKANQNKEMYLKQRYSKSGEKTNFKI